MKIEAVSQGHEALLYMERYVNEGTRSYSPFTARFEVAFEYQPRSGTPSFDLVALNAPKHRVFVFQADPSAGLLDHYLDDDTVRFMMHPEVWEATAIAYLDEVQTGSEPVQPRRQNGRNMLIQLTADVSGRSLHP